MKDIHFPQPISPSETIPHDGSSTPEIALIREKTALLFWESRDSLPIRLSGAESKLKITANSTYWEANRLHDGLMEEERNRRAVLSAPGISTIHHERHTFSSTCFSVGDNSTSGGSYTGNSTNSRKNSTIVLGIP